VTLGYYSVLLITYCHYKKTRYKYWGIVLPPIPPPPPPQEKPNLIMGPTRFPLFRFIYLSKCPLFRCITSATSAQPIFPPPFSFSFRLPLWPLHYLCHHVMSICLCHYVMTILHIISFTIYKLNTISFR